MSRVNPWILVVAAAAALLWWRFPVGKGPTDHFSWRELGFPPPSLRDNATRLARNLEVLREHLGRPIIIASGYRSPARNAKVGGAPKSQHMVAKAADLKVEGLSPRAIYDAILHLIAEGKMEEGGMGVGRSIVHYDVRGYRARWTYDDNGNPEPGVV